MNKLEKSISEEIRKWSFHYIEQPIFDGSSVCVCPYARNTWAMNKVKIVFKHQETFDDVYQAIENFDDDYDITIVVDTLFKEDPEEFHQRIESINQAVATGAFDDLNVWVMGSHPDDDGNVAVDDSEFVQTNDTDYAMIYIQRLAHLQEAANKLKHTNYYKLVFGDREPHHVFETREYFYNQLLENGYAGNEEERRYEEETPYGNEKRYCG